MWILAAKLPNSDLNFAVDFLVDFFLLFFSKEKGPKKIHQKIPRKIHPGLCPEKFPSDFCRSLIFLIFSFFSTSVGVPEIVHDRVTLATLDRLATRQVSKLLREGGSEMPST